MEFKVGDWVTFEMKVGQIKELRGDGYAEFSDGMFATSGRLVDRFRPLTLRGKRIVETFDHYYNQLRRLDGEAGFNYPDISRYFSQLTLDAIDADKNEEAEKATYEKAQQFVQAARDYNPTIDGVRLFRRNLRCA